MAEISEQEEFEFRLRAEQESSQSTAVAKEPAPKKPFVQDVRERIIQEIKTEPMRKYQQITGFIKGFTGSDPIKAVNSMSNDVAGMKDIIKATMNGVRADVTKSRGIQIPEQDADGQIAERIGNVAAIATVAYAGANAIKAGVSKIDLQRGYRKAAVESKRALNRVYNEFNTRYDAVIKPVASRVADTKSIQSEILSAADQVPEGSVAEKYLGKLIDRLDNITVEQLHSLKGAIHKTSKSMIGTERNALNQIYGKVNEALSLPQNAGTKYAQLTNEYSSFINNEAKYISSRILDKVGNITESKLSRKFSMNEKTAFGRLGARKTTGVDLLKEIKDLNRLKSAINVGGKVATKTAESVVPVAAGTGIAYAIMKGAS